jgi:hypothetical protein
VGTVSWKGKKATARLKGRMGWLAAGPVGPKLSKFFSEFFFKYIKALEIYTRRFRRNFDMKIFPKFF